MARQSWAERIARGVARGLTPSQAAGKAKPGEAIASAISGRPLRGAARKAAEARAAALPGPAPPPSIIAPAPRWEPIPGIGGLYTEARSDDAARAAIEEAARAGRSVIIHLYGAVVFAYPDPRDPNYATISQVPASILLGLLGRVGGDTFSALAEIALRQTGKGYESIEGVYRVAIKSYP